MTELDRLRTCSALLETVTGHLDELFDLRDVGGQEPYYDLWHEGTNFKIHVENMLGKVERRLNIAPERPADEVTPGDDPPDDEKKSLTPEPEHG